MRFSSRLQWDLPANRLAEALEARRRAGAEILDLTQSNPTHAGFSYPQEIREALADPSVMRYDPDPAGALEARRAVSAYYAERGAEAPPERILLASSTSEAYAWLFKLLCDPADEVLAPRPSYPLFEFLAGLEAIRIVQYPLLYEGRWQVDLEALQRAVTPRTRAVIVVHPNNPTGSLIQPPELDSLAALCAERGLALISDEVFSEFPLTPAAAPIATLSQREDVLVFSLNGLSKTAGLPQMKLAWILTGGPAPLRRRALERLELIADTYLSVGTPVQRALPRLMKAAGAVRSQIGQRVRDNFARLGTLLGSASPLEVLRADAGWYAVLRAPRTRSEEQWCLELLERCGVLVQPGYFYDFTEEAYLVVSLLTPPAVFQTGIGRLIELASGDQREG